jgi:hypothetical protein
VDTRVGLCYLAASEAAAFGGAAQYLLLALDVYHKFDLGASNQQCDPFYAERRLWFTKIWRIRGTTLSVTGSNIYMRVSKGIF